MLDSTKADLCFNLPRVPYIGASIIVLHRHPMPIMAAVRNVYVGRPLSLAGAATSTIFVATIFLLKFVYNNCAPQCIYMYIEPVSRSVKGLCPALNKYWFCLMPVHARVAERA